VAIAHAQWDAGGVVGRLILKGRQIAADFAQAIALALLANMQ
jgi:hypothetical protein